MILHNDSSFVIYLGDARDFCIKPEHKSDHLEFKQRYDYFLKIKDSLKLKKIILPKQVHGNGGFCVDDLNQYPKKLSIFEKEGDFVLTNIPRVGIGVISADCLPVVIYDPVHHAVAAVHIGWKGAVANIVEKVVDSMKQKFKTPSDSLVVYFGACAKSCCYKVQKNFLKNLEKFSFAENFILKRKDIFFDLPGFVKKQLLLVGVKPGNIYQQYNLCTMCTSNFYSFRKNNHTKCRQVTIVALK